MARKSTLIAGALVIGLTGWMASGMVGEEETPAPAVAAPEGSVPVLVETRASTAEPVEQSVLVQGDARAFRSAGLRSQASGRVETVLVEEGTEVAPGQPILTLALEDRSSRLAEAEALLAQRIEDYEAGQQLEERGFTTAERMRELRTALEQARARVAEIQSEVDNTTVTAPFAGVVNDIARRVGEVVSVGEEVATLIDNSPLRVMVRIPQGDITEIRTGAPAEVLYATGVREGGRVCVISVAAESETRTFRVEVRTPNADGSIPSGISAEVRIPTEEIDAHFLSPAILSLNDDGQLGIKAVTEDGTVAFTPVQIAQAQAEGIWVTGLPREAEIITVGQGFVRAGERVRTLSAEALPAAEPDVPERGAGAAATVPPPPVSICEDPDIAVPVAAEAAAEVQE